MAVKKSPDSDTTRARVKRTYDSRFRRETALATRTAIIRAARKVFLEKGYAAATMAGIAAVAGTAVDTVYAVAGKKPDLFRLLLEAAISGQDQPIAARQREYVLEIRRQPDAAEKLRIYAKALSLIQPRLAPLTQVLQGAVMLDPELHLLWRKISRRRARNMRTLAQELVATGALRPGLSIGKAADILWTLNSPEVYLLLVEQRGWSPAEFESWQAETWCDLLLGSQSERPQSGMTGSAHPYGQGRKE
jgi:AcrR family transcriptional regulator